MNIQTNRAESVTINNIRKVQIIFRKSSDMSITHLTINMPISFIIIAKIQQLSCMKINLDWKCRLQNVVNFVSASVYQPRRHNNINPMMTSSNGNIFRVTGPLCREFTGHRWTPLIKASDAELWFFSSICAWINDWVNNREVGDSRCHRAHYDVTLIPPQLTDTTSMISAPRIWFAATGGT